MGGTTVVTPQPDPIATQPVDPGLIPQQQPPAYIAPAMEQRQEPTYNSRSLMTGPNPNDIENYAAAVHHSRLANAINAVGSILGGNQTLRLKKNDDGSVDLQQVDSTPGEKWGRIAKAALQGAATGFAVGQGPGGPQRAAAASIQQGMAQPQQDQDKTLALADRMNNQNMQRQLFNANMAMQHQQLVKAQFENMAAPVKFDQEQTEFALHMQDVLTKMGATKQFDYKNPEEFATQLNSNTQVQQGHFGTNGQVLPISTYKDGKVVGGQAWYLPEDKRHQLNSVAVDIPFTSVDAKGNTQTQWRHVEPGLMENEQILAAFAGAQVQANQATAQGSQMRTSQQHADATTQNAATQASLAPSEIALRGAQAGLANAEARKADVEVEELPEQVRQKGQANNATLNMLENKYVSPARETEKSWQLADKTYQDYQALRKQGKDFPTGAESMLMMSRHLQSTFGQVKGSRVTKDMIAEHFGARSVSDDARAAISHIIDGGRLSPNQWTAFHKLIGESRNASWQEVADAAQARGVDATKYLPPDLGGPARAITLPGTPGAGPVVTAPQSGGGAAPPPPPKFGDIVQGHKYIGQPGSNPADPNNWQAVAPGAVQ